MIRFDVANLIGCLGAALKQDANRFLRWLFATLDSSAKEVKHLYLLVIKGVCNCEYLELTSVVY